MAGRGGGRRSALPWAGGAAIVLATAALAAFTVVVLLGDEEREGATPRSPTLTRDVTLLSAPDPAADPVAPVRLQAGVPVLPVGRSGDSGWLVLEVPGRDVSGWVPADAVDAPGDVPSLPVLGEAAPGPTASATPAAAAANGAPTQTPDYPDLAIDAVFARENRLVVTIINLGDADVGGAIFITVDGGDRTRIDVGGKPLRPGETLETVLAGEYVQRRARVTVEVLPGAGVEEQETENNRLESVVAPDLPNDLEVLSAERDAADGHLTVAVRNNSLIPLVGVVAIAVRETAPSPRLLQRLDAPLDVAEGATQHYEFPTLIDLDLGRIQVLLSSDAINDAVQANNVFPR